MPFLAGHLVREARQRAGLTQSQLAARLNTTQSVVARWERATSDIGIERLQEILRSCGLDLIPLLTIDDDGDRSLTRRTSKLTPSERARAHRKLVGQMTKLRSGGNPMSEPDFEALLGVLSAHHVKYVVIGGFAALLAGSPFPTEDVDVTPDASLANLERLSRALAELQAAIRVDGDEPVAFAHDAQSLAAMNLLNLTTKHGYLDIALIPSGTRGFADLDSSAYDAQIAGVSIRVAALADVIRSKEAAGRDKDRRVLPVLRDLLKREAQST